MFNAPCRLDSSGSWFWNMEWGYVRKLLWIRDKSWRPGRAEGCFLTDVPASKGRGMRSILGEQVKEAQLSVRCIAMSFPLLEMTMKKQNIHIYIIWQEEVKEQDSQDHYLPGTCKSEMTSAAWDIKELEPSHIAGGDGKWSSSCGKGFCSLSKSQIHNYYATQQFHY